jgi:hypothetical protein
VTNAAYSVRLTAEYNPIDAGIANSTYSNAPGRIEVYAKEFLDLTRTRMQGSTYLRIESTNHFVGSTNARITSPYSSFNLASTNYTLAIANLITPTVLNLAGSIEVWSGRWTNANEELGTILYNVTIVSSDLDSETIANIEHLKLRAPHVEISDVLNVFGSATIDAERLTITLNAEDAPTPYGELNFSHYNMVWSFMFPRLSYLTNNGVIYTANAAFFGGARTAPYYTGSFQEPYNAFVNTGDITSAGIDVWANYFESTGWMYSDVGPLIVRAITAKADEGVMYAGEDIHITADSISLRDQFLFATRAITLTPSAYLDDGSLGAGSDGLEDFSTWSAGGGINLMRLPGQASLLATEVYLTAPVNAEVINRWAGADRGCGAGGFINNAALGYLSLDGELNSMFTFMGTTGNNALYVEVLDLNNYSARFDSADTRLLGVNIRPGMKIYFGKAIVGGDEDADISERLNGKNNGAFCWVSGYTGTLPWNASDNPGTGGTGDGGSNNPVPTQPKVEYPDVPTPYSGTATTIGTYQGLFWDEAATVAHSGFLKLSVNNRGAYSGKIVIAGKSYGLSGKLDADNKGLNTIDSANLTVAFQVDDSGAGKIEGTVTIGGISSQIIADRISGQGAKSKNPFAGRYTMVLPSVENAGPGFATLLVTPSGNIVVNATLGDGTKVNQSVNVNRDGIWPLYAGLYGGQGMVLSWLQLTESQVIGNVIWNKTGEFARDITVLGSSYDSKGVNKRAILLFNTTDGGHGRLINTGGGLSDSSATVVIGKNNKVTFPNGERIKLQILQPSGAFKGNFKVPGQSEAISFRGVILQGQNRGVGLFFNGGVAGQVDLVPPTGP